MTCSGKRDLDGCLLFNVRPALAGWREARGLPADPMQAYAESEYQSKIEKERAGGPQAGWGA